MSGKSRKDSRPKVAEFFAGIGLMRLGLEAAGFRVTWANDFDASKRALYLGHFNDAAPHLDARDIRKIGPHDVPQVELATASFPCTDLSIAGGRKGLAGEHSGLFWDFADLLYRMGKSRPQSVILENVLGFLKLRNGRDLKLCLDELCELNRLGYAVDVFVVDARHFVPQSRPRLFIVGEQDSQGNVLEPRAVATAPSDDLRPTRLREFIGKHGKLRWAIRHLPRPPGLTKDLASIIDDPPVDSPQWWNEQRRRYFFDQMSARSKAWTEEAMSATGWSYGPAFRRMRNKKSTAEIRTDGLAGCLRTPKGGSARQMVVRAGKNRYDVRTMSARECACLMGAPKFRIAESVSEHRALFGFGDAVCAPAVTWIARHHDAISKLQ